jgi:hypothetical protein
LRSNEINALHGWLRFFPLIGVAVFAAGAGLLAYRYYTRPVTLTVAVGSIDGEAAKAMSALASELVSTNAPVRLKVISTAAHRLRLLRFSGRPVARRKSNNLAQN